MNDYDEIKSVLRSKGVVSFSAFSGINASEKTLRKKIRCLIEDGVVGFERRNLGRGNHTVFYFLK